MKRLLAAAAVLAPFTHAAVAGDLTLFSDSNFHGNRVTIDRDGGEGRTITVRVRWAVTDGRAGGGTATITQRTTANGAGKDPARTGR